MGHNCIKRSPTAKTNSQLIYIHTRTLNKKNTDLHKSEQKRRKYFDCKKISQNNELHKNTDIQLNKDDTHFDRQQTKQAGITTEDQLKEYFEVGSLMK